MSGPPAVFAGYPGGDGDEAVAPDGSLRVTYRSLGPALEQMGRAGLSAAAAAVAAERAASGAVVHLWRDGRQQARLLEMDPVPRPVAAEAWERLAAGVVQRHRALNAFLADAYRAAGRRRTDPDRDPEVVRAGVLPPWAVAAHPARDPDAVGLAWAGQPRGTLAGFDVVPTTDGRWLVLEDYLQVPSGLAVALANRRSARAATGALLPSGGRAPLDAETTVPLLRAALAAAAPPGSAGPPSVAVLAAGEDDGADFESRLLAEALGVPLVRPANLWPRPDGGLEATVDGERFEFDVVFRRVPDGEIAVHRAPTGQSLGGLLRDAVRAGRAAVANVPGNALADDRAAYAWVPGMIRFYLGEEPLLASARTWVLADAEQEAQVRGRLHELVLKPVGGYGGGGVVRGPECSAAELAALRAEVAAAPHRFVAQEPVRFSTAPVLVHGELVPRPVGLRVFSVADPAGAVQALPAPLTRVVGTGSSLTKDTWLLP